MKKRIFSIAMATVAMIAISASTTACNEPQDDGKKDDVVLDGRTSLRGPVTENTTLDASKVYALVGPVYVKEGVSLTIPAGTRIEAEPGDVYILVEMGGKIFINGTAAAPVVMTAADPNAKAGHWGGLVINGRAPLAGGETNVDTEIHSAYKYGGTDATDNSGEIKYLVIEYPGYAISSSIEHNGFTLNAVGSGTKVENVAIYQSGDDGIEFFGGTVDVTNLFVLNSDDDMFDFTRGYTGKLTNAYGIWEAGYSSAESDPCGIEADGNFDGDSPSHDAQSDFIVENMTIDLRLAYVAGDNARRMQSGMRIRRGCTADVRNALIKGTGRVETLLNLSDGKGGASTDTKVSLTSALTTPADAEFKYNEGLSASDYPNVTIAAGNTGCATSVFAWTGYQF